MELIRSQLRQQIRKQNETPQIDNSVVDLIRKISYEMGGALFQHCYRHIVAKIASLQTLNFHELLLM